MSEQNENLNRVSRRIAPAIIQFHEAKKTGNSPLFLADDLREFVINKVGSYLAPASPDRVLRDLRKRGRLDYRVISRSESKCEFVWRDQFELF